jgi:hypothetical protein
LSEDVPEFGRERLARVVATVPIVDPSTRASSPEMVTRRALRTLAAASAATRFSKTAAYGT